MSKDRMPKFVKDLKIYDISNQNNILFDSQK